MRILAIDPGYDRLGIAVIEGNPSRPTLVYSECFIPKKGTIEERLARIHERVERLIKEYAPRAVAVETLFFSANKTTALGVAEARGVVLALAGVRQLPVIECSPQEVKLAVTGHGAADKRAIARMIPRLIAIPARKRLDDELDAIALGIAARAKGVGR